MDGSPRHAGEAAQVLAAEDDAEVSLMTDGHPETEGGPLLFTDTPIYMSHIFQQQSSSSFDSSSAFIRRACIFHLSQPIAGRI